MLQRHVTVPRQLVNRERVTSEETARDVRNELKSVDGRKHILPANGCARIGTYELHNVRYGARWRG